MLSLRTRLCFRFANEKEKGTRFTEMSANNSVSASALAEQNPEDTYEQYEKYLHAGR